LNFLSLYSGIGAHDYGLELAGHRCVGQIEIDPFCAAVLEKHWPGLPRWSDVQHVTVDNVRRACGNIDMLTGGFMCSDISAAGKGAGLGKATRSGFTWRHMFRLIRGLRPNWLVIENVPALRSRGADRVLGVLERIGYTCWAVVVGAVHVGANFVGKRVWIVAATRGTRPPAGRQVQVGTKRFQPMSSGGSRYRRVAGSREDQFSWEEPRLVEPPLGMPADGASGRLARFASEHAIHALGNANPPQIIGMIGRWLSTPANGEGGDRP
jgi:DNA (cytosine-5)-methyltransferase 1